MTFRSWCTHDWNEELERTWWYNHLRQLVILHKKIFCCNCFEHPVRVWFPRLIGAKPSLQSTWGQHGAHLGPVGRRWAPCWPHEPCYQGCYNAKVIIKTVRVPAKNGLQVHLVFQMKAIMSEIKVLHPNVQWCQDYPQNTQITQTPKKTWT